MGMYDLIDLHYPLPDGFVPPDGTEWQTKDTPRQWLSTYRLEPDGSLVDVEARAAVLFHGCLTFCATNLSGANTRGVMTCDDTPPWWAEYVCLYDHGALLKIEGARRYESDRPHLSRAEFFAVVRQDERASDGGSLRG